MKERVLPSGDQTLEHCRWHQGFPLWPPPWCWSRPHPCLWPGWSVCTQGLSGEKRRVEVEAPESRAQPWVYVEGGECFSLPVFSWSLAHPLQERPGAKGGRTGELWIQMVLLGCSLGTASWLRVDPERELWAGVWQRYELGNSSTHGWRRKWQPTSVFLTGESQGWGSLVGCRLWGHTESDMTEAT